MTTITMKDYESAYRLIELWNSMSPLDRNLFYWLIRWITWRPSFLAWLDKSIKIVLFPQWYA